ncbi:hypothetical protein FGO68_gene38 [Halteria grandinella]|uniref:Uncharacterized protein n=1 Tax=Halteria grandinella TaxID=5974 RepID=A0A8J8NWY6_HALGN|nr:hypothetical protein FGO68_gene38 [Halteria grandinella]
MTKEIFLHINDQDIYKMFNNFSKVQRIQQSASIFCISFKQRVNGAVYHQRRRARGKRILYNLFIGIN